MGCSSTPTCTLSDSKRREPSRTGAADEPASAAPGSSNSPAKPFLPSLLRSADFFRRFLLIYTSYKITQLKGSALQLQGRWSAHDDQHQQEKQQQLWDAQHAWAGDAMHRLCIDLRGFYLKAGQFLGSRPDFVPQLICRRLCTLQDRVPPMSAELAAKVLRQELGVADLSEVFEWIVLRRPLGSASISQVHKARLRSFTAQQLQQRCSGQLQHRCGCVGGAVQGLGRLLHTAGSAALHHSLRWKQRQRDTEQDDGDEPPIRSAAAEALARAVASGSKPHSGLVAVKVQYPGALATMMDDLGEFMWVGLYWGQVGAAPRPHPPKVSHCSCLYVPHPSSPPAAGQCLFEQDRLPV